MEDVLPKIQKFSVFWTLPLSLHKGIIILLRMLFNLVYIIYFIISFTILALKNAISTGQSVVCNSDIFDLVSLHWNYFLEDLSLLPEKNPHWMLIPNYWKIK